jgi:hypothetical protein
MKILIEYESCWRNSFLDGNNNEALPKGGRSFVGSMKKLAEVGNFIKREITHDTVMGILNRMIGDQKKLYQSKNEMKYGDYYFKDIEASITFLDNPKFLNEEMVYIRNMNGSEDQNSFSGMIKGDDPIFNSDYSLELWGLLAFEFQELCDFIINPKKIEKNILLDPLTICSAFEALDKMKPVINDSIVSDALVVLKNLFPDAEYRDKNGKIKPLRFYCAGLYIQLNKLSERFNISSAKTKGGGISGISKRGFTKKDFMARFTTGEKKKIWGNPYLKNEKLKGEGEVTSMLTKASGHLEITIDVDKKKGQELKELIENAGVSAFYLGKKGLAYVSSIRL